ncbi:o-succinylbenzoate synthase [Gelidibacter salicanalis]|uniref:O-succinylbenzoate synthase n=1 Tax=Gelidibacter salicanalis TaxID=291193 RepID=A0A934NHL6_9FLAO|nr:o-succinylbenzoate synthase [Gelidibacter salicanalis]MBJ7879928.1 o-succinylbenzoate synthase [Gelidibacter salicanalis]
MTATYQTYTLNFKQPSGTSRGVLKTKDTWFVIIESNGKKGVGECGMFRGLSIDDRPDFGSVLSWTCKNIFLGKEVLISKLKAFPSIQFGLEMAFLDLESKTSFELFPSKFTEGEAAIPINGLIWMGTEAFMKEQIKSKIDAGFNCIKLKIGAIDFQAELELLKSIRTHFSATDIELRVDANGAFTPNDALEKLKRLSDYQLHSIEQPIKQGQVEEMAKLCDITPLDIALDEELIGVLDLSDKQHLLETINPQYIILKPTLVGGFQGSTEWIEAAHANSIGYWITSALESNVGLNAIAQWTYTLENNRPQGLGTGSLFTNNIASPLVVEHGGLHYDKRINWNFNL